MTDLIEPVTKRTPVWRASEEFMLRIAGLPLEAAHSLRFPDSTAWADAVLTARADLRERGAQLSDPLHRFIHEQARDEDRGAWVSLRRTLFNAKLPRDLPAAHALAATLPAPLEAQVSSWLSDRTALDEVLASGRDLIAAESAERRTDLRGWARHPRFRQGLLLASPSLDTYVDAYLRDTAPKLSKRMRRVERSVLEYVFRVSCKTSPFSSFTGVAVGRVRDGASEVHAGIVDPVWQDSVRVNVAVIGRLIDAVVADEQLLATLTVAVTPGATTDPDRVRFVRRNVVRGDDDATVAFDTVRDSMLYVRRNETLGHVLQLLAAGADMRVGALVDALVERTGTSPVDCAAYVRALLKLGLLWLPELRIDVHAADPLRAFGDSLTLLSLGGRGWAHSLAVRVVGLADLVQRYPASPPDARRTILTQLRSGLTAAFTELGQPAVSLPVTLLFEDSRCTRDVVAVDRQRWADEVSGPLQDIADVLPVFDLSLPAKLLLKGFFLARFGRGGRCTDVLSLVHEFSEDVYDEYGRVSARRSTHDAHGDPVPHENWLQLAEIDALNAARTDLVARMRTLVAGHATDVEEIVVPPRLLADAAGGLTDFERELRPQGFFVQLGGTPEQPEVVVNGTTSGLAFSFSRFTHCFGDIDLAGRVRESLRDVPPRGAVLADLVGGLHHTNLNVHAPLTDQHLLCPAEASSFDAEGQLTLEDLYVLHDEDEDRLVLRSRRLGREILPVYLGYLLPTALPEIARILLLFSPMGLSMTDLWGGVPDADPVDGVTYRPRLRHRNVVLTRRRWSVASTDLPVRDPGGDEAQWLLAWRGWQRTHGLPDQVFVTPPGRSDGDDGEGYHRRGKPMYVDFTSVFSLVVLDAVLRGSPGRIDLEEMRPTGDELYVRSDEGRHVTELAVELTRTPGPLERKAHYR